MLTSSRIVNMHILGLAKFVSVSRKSQVFQYEKSVFPTKASSESFVPGQNYWAPLMITKFYA